MKKIFIILLAFISLNAFGQDTLKLDFQTAEKLFLVHNFDLIASHYNIDINKAAARQAKLWDNPVISTDQNIFDNGSHKFFYHSKPVFGTDPDGVGQFFIQVSQVIKTGRKLNKLSQISLDQSKISQEQFEDLLRNIRYTIHIDLLQLTYLSKQESIYKNQIQILEGVIDSSGLVSSTIFNLKNELINIKINKISIETEIKNLISLRGDIQIESGVNIDFGQVVKFNIDTANLFQNLKERPDLQAAQTNIILNQDNLKYQKSLVNPDFTVGVEWDQRSSYAPNYWGLVVSVPLPVVNQNQFAIKGAKLQIEQSVIQNESAQLKAYNELLSAYKTFKFYKEVNNSEQLFYSNQDKKNYNNSLENFKNGNLSLSDFILNMNTFKDNRLKVLDQHQNLIKSIETINFLSNKNLYVF